MTYQSKKDPSIEAKIVKEEPKFGTVILELLSGPEQGKTVNITTATLKRWWRKNAETAIEALNVDIDRINTPYPEPTHQEYIPKPQSVIEYEAKQRKRYNANLPEFDAIVDDLGSISIKVNEKSKYLMLKDKSTVWRKSGAIDIYASEKTWEKLTSAGLQSKENKDKDRPFAFKITTNEDYNLVVSTLKED